jgi:Chaperone for protein-folding within the ER, fungal
MKRITVFLASLFVSTSLAQGTISGTLYAANVNGVVVVACFVDPTTKECDFAKSPYLQMQQAGSSATYTLTNVVVGHYMVFAWRDTNGNGQLEQGQDEIAYYNDANGQPALILPPASTITLQITSANASAANPLTPKNPLSQTHSAANPLTTPATSSPPLNALEGNWYQGSSSGVDYYNPTTGSWAAPSGSGFKYVFNPDGSYDYSGLMQSSLYSCTMSIFGYETGIYTVQDQMLVLTPQVNKLKSEDNCHEDFNYERDEPLEPEYKLFQFGQDEFTGEVTLELTFLKLNQGQLEVDPEYAASGPSIFWREK